MLLRDYLLLNVGRTTLAEMERWRTEMTVRRRVGASRDLLAAWRTADDELRLTAILEPRKGLPSAAELEAGLQQAVAQALGHGAAGTLPRAIRAIEQDGVLLGEAAFMLSAGADRRVVANAVAYYFEERFGYAQAAKHPVAFEESLRPGL